ncbi:MAG: hypothetical protein R6X32_01475 [Chloroflexota bacterium]
MKKEWLPLAAVPLVLLLFIALSWLTGGLGFPLDDAWIHQTYARNLVRSGGWEFVPGVPSSGSTSPLWTLLLALGYGLNLPYRLWAYLLGGLSLFWLAWNGMALWRQVWPERADMAWVAGLLLVGIWPLVWAAVSGMETLLFAALGMQLIVLYGNVAERPLGEQHVREQQAVISEQYSVISRRSVVVMGVLAGLLILTRPDGVVLLLLLGVGLLLGRGEEEERPFTLRLQTAVLWGVTALLLLLPYFALNYWLSGTAWPNTFYAKQEEYAVVLARPLWERVGSLLYLSLGGPPQGWQGMSSPHLLLLPGLLWAGWLALRSDWGQKRLWHTLPLLWAGGHVLLYAWRLPVTYQHGRYIMAAMPVWTLYGLAGSIALLLLFQSEIGTLLRRVAALSFAAMMAIFILLGAQAYAADVAFIEGEMVTVAHWLAENTEPQALIASHDIGAIGYFAERPLLDLAGLITPEIIPLLSNEAALAHYVLASDADYLVTAPGWPYSDVTGSEAATLVFSTGYEWTQLSGLNNMAVYKLQRMERLP